jgi:Cu-Zn family superoxide dismutase
MAVLLAMVLAAGTIGCGSRPQEARVVTPSDEPSSAATPRPPGSIPVSPAMDTPVLNGSATGSGTAGGSWSEGRSATATLQAGPDQAGFSGTVTFTQEGNGLRIVAQVAGVTPDGQHGFHLHETGDCTHAGAEGKHFTTAGGHFNPNNAPHACPPTAPRHAGDFGNLQVSGGSGRVETTTDLLTLDAVVGKAIILHAGPDDCTTQPSGSSGDRLACGVVRMGPGTGPTETPMTVNPPNKAPDKNMNGGH